jgi:hypothetical protein
MGKAWPLGWDRSQDLKPRSQAPKFCHPERSEGPASSYFPSGSNWMRTTFLFEAFKVYKAVHAYLLAKPGLTSFLCSQILRRMSSLTPT